MLGFLKEAFSDNGVVSSSRLMMAVHAVAGITWVSFIVMKNHVLPDGATMAGVTGFVAAPYAINVAGNAVKAFGGKSGSGS